MKTKKTLHITPNSNYMQVVIDTISKLEEGLYDMIIMDKEQARSGEQNKLLWGVIYKGLSDQTGYTEQQLHDILRSHFNLKDENGDLVSTSTLTKSEFNDYVEKIIKWSITNEFHIEKTGT